MASERLKTVHPTKLQSRDVSPTGKAHTHPHLTAYLPHRNFAVCMPRPACTFPGTGHSSRDLVGTTWFWNASLSRRLRSSLSMLPTLTIGDLTKWWKMMLPVHNEEYTCATLCGLNGRDTEKARSVPFQKLHINKTWLLFVPPEHVITKHISLPQDTALLNSSDQSPPDRPWSVYT